MAAGPAHDMNPAPSNAPKRYPLIGFAFIASFVFFAAVAADQQGGLEKLQTSLNPVAAPPAETDSRLHVRALPKDMQRKFVELGRQIRRIECIGRFRTGEPSSICIEAMRTASEHAQTIGNQLVHDRSIAAAELRIAGDAQKLAAYARQTADAATRPGGLASASLTTDAKPEALATEAERIVTRLDEVLVLDDPAWGEESAGADAGTTVDAGVPATLDAGTATDADAGESGGRHHHRKQAEE